MLAETPLFSSPQRTSDSVQIIPGTKLKVGLPKDWRIEAAPKELNQPYALKHITPPEYAVVVSQSNPATHGHSCAGLIGSMQAIPSLRATVIPRPNFVPATYLGSILVLPTVQLACLSMGNSFFSVMISLKTGEPMPVVLTEILTIIADAARDQALVITAPGRLTLPLLGIEIPIRRDAWGYQQISDTWGKVGVLGRVSKTAANELMITPFVFPGRCETFIRTPPFGAAKLEKGRNYGGDRWHPDALEEFPPPFKGLLAYACHDVGNGSVLLARIEYEKPVVALEDMKVIREVLDDIGRAIDMKNGRK
jgi:hypothetical protein